MDEPTEAEGAFHDDVIAHGTRRRVAPFYSITKPSKAHYSSLALDSVAGLHVLEYGCGVGSQMPNLANRGAIVTAIDVSDEAVRRARSRADEEGLDATILKMDAHHLEFGDESFDRVCGSGILHHLDLDRAFSEVARVLKAGGSAVFFEPMGHNPAINWYRRRTPDLRTEDEHPLLMPDLDAMHRYFSQVECTFFHLTSLTAIALRNTRAFDTMHALCTRADASLFRMIPWLRRFAWIVVIELRGPGRYSP